MYAGHVIHDETTLLYPWLKYWDHMHMIFESHFSFLSLKDICQVLFSEIKCIFFLHVWPVLCCGIKKRTEFDGRWLIFIYLSCVCVAGGDNSILVFKMHIACVWTLLNQYHTNRHSILKNNTHFLPFKKKSQSKNTVNSRI